MFYVIVHYMSKSLVAILFVFFFFLIGRRFAGGCSILGTGSNGAANRGANSSKSVCDILPDRLLKQLTPMLLQIPYSSFLWFPSSSLVCLHLESFPLIQTTTDTIKYLSYSENMMIIYCLKSLWFSLLENAIAPRYLWRMASLTALIAAKVLRCAAKCRCPRSI